MSKYGDVAVRATELLQQKRVKLPRDAWGIVAREIFSDSESSQEKGCPRAAYLGLCEEGLVVGVEEGKYSGRSGNENKKYAIRGFEILKNDRSAINLEPRELWERIFPDGSKSHNSQMDVVLALAKREMLDLSRS